MSMYVYLLYLSTNLIIIRDALTPIRHSASFVSAFRLHSKIIFRFGGVWAHIIISKENHSLFVGVLGY